jgi:glycosyltransferase involved in cell wall biosynthesis
MIYLGLDWAEDHHDVALMNEAGTVLDERRIGDTMEDGVPCARRPIVGVMPDENDAAKAFRESGGGDVVPPTRGEEAAAAVLALLGDEGRRFAIGAAARVYVERTFDVVELARQFERVFQAAAVPKIPRVHRSV